MHGDEGMVTCVLFSTFGTSDTRTFVRLFSGAIPVGESLDTICKGLQIGSNAVCWL